MPKQGAKGLHGSGMLCCSTDARVDGCVALRSSSQLKSEAEHLADFSRFPLRVAARLRLKA